MSKSRQKEEEREYPEIEMKERKKKYKPPMWMKLLIERNENTFAFDDLTKSGRHNLKRWKDRDKFWDIWFEYEDEEWKCSIFIEWMNENEKIQ